MNSELLALALISLEETFSKGDKQTTVRFEMNQGIDVLEDL